MDYLFFRICEAITDRDISVFGAADRNPAN